MNRNNWLYYIALMILLIIGAASVGAPLFVPYDPIEPNLDVIKQAPSLLHPMGTDDRGRDILSRIMMGGMFSISLGVFSTAFALIVGILMGFLAGYFGKWVDSFVGLLTNITLAFPALLLAIALSSAMRPGYWSIFITLVAIGWAGFARLMRAETLRLKNSPHVEAARVLGADVWYIFLRHILPLCGSILITAITLRVGVAILMESSLSFLGLGIQPPQPTWGGMVSQGRDYFRSAPWITMFPGAVLTLTILSLHIIGENYRGYRSKRIKK